MSAPTMACDFAPSSLKPCPRPALVLLLLGWSIGSIPNPYQEVRVHHKFHCIRKRHLSLQVFGALFCPASRVHRFVTFLLRWRKGHVQLHPRSAFSSRAQLCTSYDIETSFMHVPYLLLSQLAIYILWLHTFMIPPRAIKPYVKHAKDEHSNRLQFARIDSKSGISLQSSTNYAFESQLACEKRDIGIINCCLAMQNGI